ncbi:MAG: c-type cytochrome [Caulobacteraceae bacterium]
MKRQTLAAISSILLTAALSACAPSHKALVARGQYLVSVIGCSDCHTPGGFSPKPDMSRFLGGSDVQFEVTGLGVYAPPNLTPDDATGLGKWSVDQIATAITTGVIPDGRVLAPPMPWQAFSHLSRTDALAIATYLKGLQPVSHQVPPPGSPVPEPPGTVIRIAQIGGGAQPSR